MLAHLLIGTLVTVGLIMTVRLGRKRQPAIKLWQWIPTFLGFLYLIFVLEVVVSFLEEGAAQGAVVMGTILGFGAMVWAFLLARFVFAPRSGKENGK